MPFDDEDNVHADPTGIIPGFKDNAGVWRETADSTRHALILSMGLDPLDPRPALGPQVRVLGPGESFAVPGPADLLLEDGTRLRVNDRVPPDLPIGYHVLLPQAESEEIRIIKRPGTCWWPAPMKGWGWAVQLYGARSRSSWGIGDLGDLRQLAQWSAKQGAGMLLHNPLCAVAPGNPQEASPYYPSSRRFRNPIYLNIETIPGAADARVDLPRVAEAARRLNGQRMIDRDRVWRLKMEALDDIWDLHIEAGEFDGYVRELGESLHGFASYCVLAERFGPRWRAWPEEYRRPDSAAVQRYAQDHLPRVRFHMWLQWLLDEQLASAAAELPLVNDLPIGVDPEGADAWQWQDVFAEDVTVGAPPDQFNPEGQDWTLPPFIPHRLRAARFTPFIETIRASLRHAGGLRIDHVMGLFRLYWVPRGFGPQRGAYVRYPSDELLAIVAVESHRAGAWIAGEDLGTVEHSVRRRLAENHILSYKLLWFEDRPPRDFPELSLAAVSTHDLPTIVGLWTGADLAAEQQIGLGTREDGYREMRDRLIKATGLAPDASPHAAVAAAYEALGHSPSAVLVASLEDALSVAERPNMPGTTEQWPNWSLALPRPLEEIGHSPLPDTIANALRRR